MPAEIKTDIKGIDKFIFCEGADKNKLHLHVTEVAAGKRAHSPHKHEGHEIFWVLAGEGEVIAGEVTYTLSKNQAIQVDGRVLHGIRNSGDSILRYAVIVANG